MKRFPRWLGLVVAFAVAAVCVRLGFWQVSRLHEKQALNARLRAALAAPPRPAADADRILAAGTPDSLRFSRFAVRGSYDPSHQFLLMGRAHDGEPGVEVVTPLLPDDGGEAILVDRGWIPAFDGATAKPSEYPAAGTQALVGLAEPISRTAKGAHNPYRRVEIETLSVWTAVRVDPDSVATRLPYAVRGWVLRALPDPGADAAELPARAQAKPFDETMHRSYAGQWFAFAAILVVGSLILAFRRPKPEDGVPPAAEG